MKVLIIGLDGSTWNVIDDYLLQNHMPNLNKLKKEGYSGILRSTEPPASPVAWTSFLTGCNPGKHGVTGFHSYSVEDHSLGIQNSTYCLVPNMYQQLSKQGYKVISINVPWTYPCYKINGVMVAGLGFGGIDSDFTYPTSFKEELLAKIPKYDFRALIHRREAGQENIKQDIEKVQRSYHDRVMTVKMACEKTDWDVLVVQFHDTDAMNHSMWKYISRDSRDEYSKYRDEVFKSFRTLDKCIGELLNMVDRENTTIILMSDHGGDRLTALIKANLLLKKWGYLKLKSKLKKRLLRPLKSLKKRLGMQTKSVHLFEIAQTSPDRLGINLKKSRAFITHTAIPSGHLYLNIKGRQPTGFIEPGAESERVIEELKKKFLSVTDPSTGEPIFTGVVTPSELYDGKIQNPERIGDLIFIPRQGYELTSSPAKRGGPICVTPDEIPYGTHHPDGICIVFGAGVKAASGCQANIIDIAPTVYALLGAKLPRYMDGKVLQEAFFRPLDISYMEEQDEIKYDIKETFEFPKSEEEEVNKRLEELGYM